MFRRPWGIQLHVQCVRKPRPDENPQNTKKILDTKVKKDNKYDGSKYGNVDHNISVL